MIKKLFYFASTFLLIVSSCSDDNSTNNNPPAGEVLLAEIQGDSVGIQNGSSSRIQSISSGQLNFTDRDSARISFYYSRANNFSSSPMSIYFSSGSTNVNLYQLDSSSSSENEVYVNVTVPSPRVNDFFYYKINSVGLSGSGFSYMKFREMKIYKK